MIRVSQALTDQQEWEVLRPALERSYYGHAERVVEFEHAIAEYLRVSAGQVICVANGTAALHLALHGIGISPKDEVIVPTLTFVSSFAAIAATGAKPIACDVSYRDLCLDLEDVKGRLTKNTRAIMPVHYAGNPCDMDEVLNLAKQKKLRIIEDAAHAFGSLYKGRKVGSFGDITCFSFDSIKNITCGEGGAIICRNPELADRYRKLRLLGINRDDPLVTGYARTKAYDVPFLGFRYHMSNLNAVIGLVQISKIDRFVKRRQEICRKYDIGFSDLKELETLPIDYSHVAPFMYVIKVLDGHRDTLITYLMDRDIETAINYIPNHLHSYYRNEGSRLKTAERLYTEILSIPLHCALSDEEVQYVIHSIRDFFKNS
ncbi:MAG: DegT/DnrJ/EryC1/StrS family aminotransferase [Candidatus Hodarchaeota archaeon]